MTTITRARIPESIAKHPSIRPKLMMLVDECLKKKRVCHAHLKLPTPHNPTDDIVLIRATYYTKRKSNATEDSVLLEPAETQGEIDMIAWDLRRKADMEKPSEVVGQVDDVKTDL